MVNEGRLAMAELVNLQDADEQQRKILEMAEQIKSKWTRDVTNNLGVTWSNGQIDDLALLYNMIVHVNACLRSVMHNNRDGRGTVRSSSRHASVLGKG